MGCIHALPYSALCCYARGCPIGLDFGCKPIFFSQFERPGTARAVETLMGRVDRHSLSLQFTNHEDEYVYPIQDVDKQIRYDAKASALLPG